MRHLKHKNQLGVKKEHRVAVMANLAAALIREGRITTTLKKAKALRPFAERLVTLAKKGTLHHRRLAIARVRDKDAVRELFDEKVTEFSARNGGYTRIYKLGTRTGDAAEMALIEWVGAGDEGYKSSRRKRGKGKSAKTAAKSASAADAAETAEEPEAEAKSVEEAGDAKAPQVESGPEVSEAETPTEEEGTDSAEKEK